MLKPAMILLWLKVNIIRYWIENTSIIWSDIVNMGLCCALYIDIDGPVCSHLEKSLTCQLVIWWLASTDSVTVINCSCFEAHRSTLVTWFSTRGNGFLSLYTMLKFGCLWQGVYTLLLHTDQGVRRVALSLVKSLEKFRYIWTPEIYTTLSI